MNDEKLFVKIKIEGMKNVGGKRGDVAGQLQARDIGDEIKAKHEAVKAGLRKARAARIVKMAAVQTDRGAAFRVNALGGVGLKKRNARAEADHVPILIFHKTKKAGLRKSLLSGKGDGNADQVVAHGIRKVEDHVVVVVPGMLEGEELVGEYKRRAGTGENERDRRARTQAIW